MTCSNCGKDLADGMQFCDQCGCEIVLTAAKKQPNHLKMIGLAAFIICLALFLVGYLSVHTVDLDEIPIFAMLADDAQYTVKRTKVQLLDDAQWLEDRLERDLVEEDEIPTAEAIVEACYDLSETVSINHIKNYIEVLDEASSDLGEALYEVDDDLEAIDLLEGVIIGFLAVPLLLTLVAGITRKFGFAIPALVTALPFYFLFGGYLWGLLAIAGYVTQIVVYSMMKAAKRKAILPV